MDIKSIESFLKQNNAYIMASIDGEGCHVGRFKGISQDADDAIVLEVDI